MDLILFETIDKKWFLLPRTDKHARALISSVNLFYFILLDLL